MKWDSLEDLKPYGVTFTDGQYIVRQARSHLHVMNRLAEEDRKLLDKTNVQKIEEVQ